MLWHSYRGTGAALLFQRVPPFRAASISMLGPQSPELCARPVFRNFSRGVQKIERAESPGGPALLVFSAKRLRGVTSVATRVKARRRWI